MTILHNQIGICENHMIDLENDGFKGCVACFLYSEIQRLEAMLEKVLQNAKSQSMEAVTQRSIVHEIYRYCGIQKGDWNGAKPVIEYIESIKSINKETP